VLFVILGSTKEGWAMQKKYIVRLSDAERETLQGLLKQRRVSSQKVRRAHVLLKADAQGPNWCDHEIAAAFECPTRTVELIRERLVTEGFEIALNGKPKRRVRRKVLDGEQEAKIIALRLGQPPSGFANWTLRLLAEQAVALEIVESVSHETLRRTLKKTPPQQNSWVNSGSGRAPSR
jgi:Homeodomain-like domain